MSGFNLELEASPMIIDNITTPHIYAIVQNVLCGTGGEFRMIVGSRAEIEERVTAADGDSGVTITQLL